jgi:hypothetical protein
MIFIYPGYAGDHGFDVTWEGIIEVMATKALPQESDLTRSLSPIARPGRTVNQLTIQAFGLS